MRLLFPTLLLVAIVLPTGCAREDTRSSVVIRGDSLSTTGKRTGTLESLRDSLKGVGSYDCCTDPSCDDCVRDSSGCFCYPRLKRSEPICGGCLRGYKAGNGKLKLASIPELERIRERAGKKDP